MKKKIALVDDDPNIRRAIAEEIEYWGYEAITFKGASDFYENGDGLDSYDAILIDLMMPVNDGLSLLKKLDIPSKKPIKSKIAIISALDDSDFKSQAKLLGANDYIFKPDLLDNFTGRIEVLLSS